MAVYIEIAAVFYAVEQLTVTGTVRLAPAHVRNRAALCDWQSASNSRDNAKAFDIVLVRRIAQ